MENKFENLRVLALERFNYFCSRKKAQKSIKRFLLSILCIFVAMFLIDLL